MKASKWYLLVLAVGYIFLITAFAFLIKNNIIFHEKITNMHATQVQLLTQVAQLQHQVNNIEQDPMIEIYAYLDKANMYLTVLYDVKTALQLQQWTQQHLSAHVPQGLQDALMTDILALQAVNVPMINSITQTLAQISEQVQMLPVRGRMMSEPTKTENTAATAVTWHQALGHALGELKNLIRIQPRHASMDYVLFDETILKETVRVELQRASIAAVIGQNDLYQTSLQQAILALQQFFASDDAAVQAVQTQISQLLLQPIVPVIPPANQALLWLQHNGIQKGAR